MTIDRIHADIKLEYNKLDSNHLRDIPKAFIDDILNIVTNDYIEMFYNGTNVKGYTVGFEVTQQRIDMLSTFVVGEPEQPKLQHIAVDTSNSEYDIYTYDLSQTVEPYRHLVRAKFTTNCGDFEVQDPKHDDLNAALRDEYQKPSKLWRRVLRIFRRNVNSDYPYLIIYAPKDIIPTGLLVEYIKQPIKAFVGGYNTLEYINGDLSFPNANSPQIQSEIPKTYHPLLIQMAVQELARIQSDTNRFTLQQEQIQRNTA